MAYKKAAAKRTPTKSYRANRTEEPQAPRTREESNREANRGNAGRFGRGRDNGGSRGGDDMEFVRVTGLFEGKKAGTFSVGISYDMADILKDVRGGSKEKPGDRIGVSEDDEGKMYLWIGKRS